MIKFKHKAQAKFPDTERIKDEIIKEFGEDLGKVIIEAFRNIYDDLTTLEKIERVSTLPTASLNTKGKFYVVEGGANPDKLYVGIDEGGGTYSFKEIPLSVLTTFLDLSDTPSSYTSHAGKSVRVNSGESALEFSFPEKLVSGATEVTAAEAKDAVNKAHNQNTDTKLVGGANDAVTTEDNGEVNLPKQSAVRADRATAQTIPNQVWTIVQYDTKTYDVQNEYDNVTNFRFTASKAGKYSVNAYVLTALVAWSAGHAAMLGLFKNGTLVANGYRSLVFAAINGYLSLMLSTDVDLAVNDYIDIRAYIYRGAATDTFPSSGYNHLTIHKLS